MKTRIFTSILLALTTIIACKKEDTKPDLCANLICLNGGTCNDGVCICINGYSGQVCETPPDPCAGITCLNGGTCANGICNCPSGYTGSDCSQQQTPKSISIKKVKLTTFPITDSGGGSWDFSNGADVYLRLTKPPSTTTIGANPADKVTNATSFPIEWDVDPDDFVMDSPESTYRLAVYDADDLDADDLMGWIEFVPYWDNNGFPQILTLECVGCVVSYELSINYDF